MNDDQILQMGGDENDIERYAMEHGANLTEEDIVENDMLKEFDNFLKNHIKATPLQREALKFFIANFMEQEKTLIAKKIVQTKNETIEEIEKKIKKNELCLHNGDVESIVNLLNKLK